MLHHSTPSPFVRFRIMRVASLKAGETDIIILPFAVIVTVAG